MRSSMPAQSLDSVPPAPELISTIGVVAVGLAGQQGLQLGAGGAVLDGLQLGAGLLEGGLVALLVGHLGIA